VAKVTMKQIAEIAGVSTSTVSRVFHSPEKVNPITRQKILQTVEENR
jgi:DNA-binding LacI/PurR family transcriptional regulator